jgi:ATP synthase protein I
MPGPDPSREEALRRLNERASALETRTTKPVRDYGAAAVNQGYKLVAQLIGGVLVGVALGFGIDAYAHSAPLGMIVGVLLGFGVSVWLAVRTAKRLQEDALKAHGPGTAVPSDDDEDEGA